MQNPLMHPVIMAVNKNRAENVNALTAAQVTAICESAGGSVSRRFIAFLQAMGVTRNSDIASALGVTIRAVKKAKAGTTVHLGGEPQFTRGVNRRTPGGVNHSSLGGEPQFASDRRSNLAYKESPSEILSYLDVKKESKCERESPRTRERTRDVFLEPGRNKPTSNPAIVYRGKALVVTRQQHAEWQTNIPEFEEERARGWYAIADAECAERGKVNGAAVLHTQKKLGFLAADAASASRRQMTPAQLEEAVWREKARAEGRQFMGRG